MFSVLLAKFSSLKQKLCSLKGQVVTGWTNKDQVLIIPVKYLYTLLWAVKIIYMQFFCFDQVLSPSQRTLLLFTAFIFLTGSFATLRKVCFFFPPLKTILPECWAKQILWKGIPAAFQTENAPIHIVLKLVGVWLYIPKQLSVEQQAELSHIKG